MPSSAARSLAASTAARIISRPPMRVHVDEMHVRAHELRHRRTDRSRDIVQLRIHEHADVARFAVRENPLGIPAERFQTNLDDHVELVKAIHELLRRAARSARRGLL